MRNGLISSIIASRAKYNRDRDPQAGYINALEASINSGQYHEDEVLRAETDGLLRRGNSSYYVMLA